MTACQSASSSKPENRFFYLVSLLLSSCACLGGAGASTSHIVGTRTSTPVSATVSNRPLLDSLRMGRDEEESNESMSRPGQNTAPTATSLPTGLFTLQQHESFARDGFLVMSDMLEVPMLQDLTSAGEAFMANAQKMDAYFSSIEMGMIFQAGSDVSGANNTNHTVTKAFRKVAFDSVLPRAAAELMQLSPSQHVRVLR